MSLERLGGALLLVSLAEKLEECAKDTMLRDFEQAGLESAALAVRGTLAVTNALQRMENSLDGTSRCECGRIVRFGSEAPKKADA